MNACPHFGSAFYYHWDQGFDEYRCGSTVPGYRTNRCVEIEPIWKELQSAKARIKRLISAGDVLCEIQTGPSGRAAIERWNQAKEAKP